MLYKKYKQLAEEGELYEPALNADVAEKVKSLMELING